MIQGGINNQVGRTHRSGVALIAALTHLNLKKDPFVLPGSAVKTTPNDHFPISQMQLERFKDGTWTTFGPLIDGRGK